MKKANILKSSEFYMAAGDKLSMLFIDEQGTPVTITVNSVSDSGDNIESVPDAPVALPASDITSSAFTANWNFMENTLGFYLDVAEDSAFTSMVAGYDNLDVGLVNEYSVVGLDDAITYYYRLRGYNDYGTGTDSNTITTTTDIESVVDGDGNAYTYVTIGTQQWLVENLRTTKYIDGTAIPNLTLAGDWISDVTGAYCAYDNDPANAAIYGYLYNWYAVDNAHGIAPTGWRVPTQADMETLSVYLGGDMVAGGKLKEIGLTFWTTPNTDAVNEVGFSGRGTGLRLWGSGVFFGKNESTLHWSSTDSDPTRTYIGLGLAYNQAIVDHADLAYKANGAAIRCMRDVV